jgi:hypothetical protein
VESLAQIYTSLNPIFKVALVRAKKMHSQAVEALKLVRKQAAEAGWEDVKDQPEVMPLTAAAREESVRELKTLLHKQKKMQKLLTLRQNQAQLDLEDLMNVSTGN